MINAGDVESHYSDTQGYRMPSIPQPGVVPIYHGFYGAHNDDYNQMQRPPLNANRPIGSRNGRDEPNMEHGLPEREGPASFVQPNSVLDENFSTDYEETCSELLEHLITNELRVCDSPEEKKHKEQVLFKLNEILKRWMHKVRERHGKRPDDVHSNAVLLCIGSYKLGVSSPTGDIDTVILAHSFVKRDEDFFGILYPLLEEMSHTDPAIKDVNKVNQEHTVTPLIQMTFHGIPIDMQFATLDQNQMTENLKDYIENRLDSDDCLSGMDEKMKRSYNGYRNAMMIPRSMKRVTDSDMMNQKRELVFRTTLRIIKLWAKNNQLDSNKLGYLGGLSWAILTAKICRLYPYKSPAKLLERFFHLYGYDWKWGSGEHLVRIVPPTPLSKMNTLGRAMYVMTPATPQMNSTYNATTSTREIIITRMREAHTLMLNLLTPNSRGVPLKSDWLKLFNKFDFFAHYEHFIEINILTGPGSDHLSWWGFVEAKVRRLVENYEELQKFYDLKIHPWPQCFERDARLFPGYLHTETMYIGLALNQPTEDHIDLTLPLVRFVDFLEADWNKENKIRNPQEYNIGVCYRTKEEIPPDIWPTNSDGQPIGLLSKALSQLSEGASELPENLDLSHVGTPKSPKRLSLRPSAHNEDEDGQMSDTAPQLVLSARKSTLKDDIREAEDEAEMEPLPNEGSNHLGEDSQQSSPNLGYSRPKFVPNSVEDLYSQFDDFLNRPDLVSNEYLSKRIPFHQLNGREASHSLMSGYESDPVGRNQPKRGIHPKHSHNVEIEPTKRLFPSGQERSTPEAVEQKLFEDEGSFGVIAHSNQDASTLDLSKGVADKAGLDHTTFPQTVSN